MQSMEAISCISFGCILSMFAFEHTLSSAPGSGTLLLLSQFVLIIVVDSKTLFRKRNIPLRYSLSLAIMYFTSAFLTTKPLDYEISVPVHIVVRSSGLAASLFLGRLFLGKKYPIGQVIGTILVTLGLIFVTIGENPDLASMIQNIFLELSSPSTLNLNEIFGDINGLQNKTIGYLLLFASLLLSALVGHYQEHIFKINGKHPSELKYFSHLFGFPMFFLYDNEAITSMFGVFTSSEGTCSWLGVGSPKCPWMVEKLPYLVSLALIHSVCSYICISGVYKLSSAAGAVTCNFVLTVRKFVSLIISVIFFNNEFSTHHWIGTCLVFSGVLLYSRAGFKHATEKAKAE